MGIEIKNQTYDEERALYNLTDATVIGCRFEGPADGESAFKEAKRIAVNDCFFALRYPLWHVEDFTVEGAEMALTARAALWYSYRGKINSSKLHGVKALRECADILLTDCDIVSPEFGWKCDRITLDSSSVTSEYLFFDSKDITLKNVKMSGKYSFQYVENLVIEDSFLDTKDAFWHVKNAHIKNSVVKGEYLGWFSEGLTLTDCRIIGTQPLCYCKDLKLINCTMEGCDLSFEYSDVQADITGAVDSVKNPKSGVITLDSVGEIIFGDSVMDCNGQVKIRGENNERTH